MHQRASQRGFTLIEMVMVITLTGIVVGMVAVFIAPAFTAYIGSSARAQLVDAADSALRRIGGEVSYALPNSVRVSSSGTSRVLEFIPTSAAAQYANNGSNPLSFGVSDASFDIVGPPLLLASASQALAFYNLGPGNPGADAYAQENVRFASNAAGSASTVNLSSSAALPSLLNAPPFRVYAIGQPITYRCDTATGLLVKHWNYGFLSTQPNPPATGQSAVLARGVSRCLFVYEPAVVAARTGLMTMTLTLTHSLNSESINLYQSAHVSNLP